MTRVTAIRCVLAAAALVAAACPTFGQDRPTECQFLPGTAIPRLVMGVCRPGDPPEFRDQGQLEVWDSTTPATDAEPVAVLPLFVPLYVYEERPGVGTTWYRVGDAYATSGERGTRNTTGWVDGRRLLALSSRYAYHFQNPKRVPPGVQLYESRQAAYAALAALQRKPPAADAGKDVLVTENLDADAWDPLRAGAIPPFVELPDEPNADAEGPLTDTTLTFPQPTENRLVRVGAVCGGPIKADELEALRKDAEARAGIEIVFVIDETLSMEPSFDQVADFIEQNLTGDGDMTNVKVAVSWYSDQTEQTKKDGRVPFDVEPLAPIVGPGMEAAQVQEAKRRIVKEVRDNVEQVVKGDVNPRELVFEGLEAAIAAAGLTPGENAMVFVIGDAGDRSDTATLEEHYERVTTLVLKHNLQLAFIQVAGPGVEPDEAFVRQAQEVKKRLPADKQDAVVIEAVNNQKLAMRIADIQARMEAKRRKLERDIARLESRNRYTRPGRLMQERIESDGLTVEQFDERKLQYFAPAYGWLYHPQQPGVEPQLRELVFMAKPEVDALMATLITVAEQLEKTEQLEKNGRVDGDGAVRKFAAVLAKNSGHSQVAEALQAAWESMPAEERTFGQFLRDKVGLRVRSSILHHRGVAKPTPATAQAAALLRESKSRLFSDGGRAAVRPGLPPPVWHDSWKVLP